MSAHLRLPLVLAASRHAQDDAARLGLRGCLENKVHAAISAGEMHGEPSVGGSTLVYIDDAVAVEVRRVRAPSGRRAWRPTRVLRSRPLPKGEPCRS